MDTSQLEGHVFVGGGTPVSSPPRPLIGALDWRQSVGGALIVVALVVIGITWFQISGTLQPGKQMPYVISGGLTAAVLCAAGVTFLVAYEHVCDRAAIEELYQRVDDLEESVQVAMRAANSAPRPSSPSRPATGSTVQRSKARGSGTR